MADYLGLCLPCLCPAICSATYPKDTSGSRFNIFHRLCQILFSLWFSLFFLDSAPSRLCHVVCTGHCVSCVLHSTKPFSWQCHFHQLLRTTCALLGERIQVRCLRISVSPISFGLFSPAYKTFKRLLITFFVSVLSESITPTLDLLRSLTETQVRLHTLSFVNVKSFVICPWWTSFV